MLGFVIVHNLHFVIIYFYSVFHELYLQIARKKFFFDLQLHVDMFEKVIHLVLISVLI